MPHRAAIVFDLDGTLIDSVPDIAAAANAMLAEFGAPALPVRQIGSFVGKGAPNLIRQTIAAAGLAEYRFEQALTVFLGHYETAHDLTTLYPGVLDTLDRLKTRGHALGICTNKPHAPTVAVLDHFALTPLFDVVISGDSLPVRKPDPAPLLAAFGSLGHSRRFYVGDSETDADTALAAGIPFALFTEGYRKSPVEALPHRWAFSDWHTLPDLFG